MKGDSQQDLLLAPSAHCLTILAVQRWGTPPSSVRDLLGPSLPAARVHTCDPVCTNRTCSFQTFQKGVK